jgi:hypothetical protein
LDTKAGIIAGHGRLLPARKLGLTEVPVIVRDHPTEAQKRAYESRTTSLLRTPAGMRKCSASKLRLFREFRCKPAGLRGCTCAASCGSDAAAGLTDEDAIPGLPETPVSKTGDLWMLGEHKLLVGDATNQGDVARLIAGEVADLVFTDPQYNVDYEGYTEQKLKIKGDRMSDADFK